jgi:hypothetical protein
VSKKVGYTDHGWRRVARQGGQATIQGLVLDPDSLVRYEHALSVEGLEAFRRSIGLDA